MLEMISATGFLAIFGWPRLIWPGRQETARFPGELAPQADQPSAGFVSMTVRRIARSRVRLNDRALSLR
jgi:hypothetical protein